MATEVGTAYVSVLAKTADAERGIKAALDKSVKESDKAGKTMGDKLAVGLTKNMDKTGAKTGAAFEKGFSPKVASSGKNAMAGLGQFMMGSAEGIGGNVGGGIMGGIVGALNQGASKAITALEGVGVKGGAGMSSKLVAAGTIAAGGIALVTAAAAVAGKALYDIGDGWDAISDGILFKTGKVGAELDKITDSIKKVGLSSFAPIEDISGVTTGLVKGLGLQGESLEKMTKQITDYNSMAKENGVEPLNLNEFMKAMKRFKMDKDVDGMMGTLEGLFDVSQETNIPLNSLVSTMKQIGTQARDFKLPATTVIQILSEFDAAGMDASTAIVGFRTAMNKLATESDPAGALRTQITTIEELANSSDEASQAKAREMAQTMFGNKAWQTYFDLIRDGKIDVDNLVAVTAGSGDTISETRDKTADFSQEWEKFKNFLKVDLEPVATFVFGAMNNQLTYLTNNIRDGIGAIKNFIDTFRDKWAQAKKDLQDDGGLFGPNSAFGRIMTGLTGGGWNFDTPVDGGGGANMSSAGLQPQTAALQDQIAKAFPAVKNIGGYRAQDKYPDHPSGKAIDVMIPPEMVGTPQGRQLGDAINRYALANGAAYTMWGRSQWFPDGGVKNVPDRGNPTENHMDHVHILTRDTGGVLPPGVSVIRNGTGKDELILNPAQQQFLANQGIDVNALLAGTQPPLEDEPGWDWRTQGNKRGGPGVDPNARAPLEDEPGWDWQTQGNKRGGPGVDPNYSVHGGSKGAAPGPTQTQTASNRTEGFIPVAASNTGVPGTSMVSNVLNMGAEAASGAIDMAAQVASMGAMMGGGGAGAGAGIQVGAAVAKRAVSYGFQMAGIGADALIEQLFPFGAPRWIGYDYTSFAPGGGGGGQPTGVTTGEDATNAALGLVDPEQPPEPGLSTASSMDVENLQAQASPPLVNIGSINGVNPDDVGKIITDRQRLAQMQYGGRP